MDITYCHKKCCIGQQKSDEFLNRNNSAYDAAVDFWFFVDECFKTCPYATEHNKQE